MYGYQSAAMCLPNVSFNTHTHRHRSLPGFFYFIIIIITGFFAHSVHATMADAMAKKSKNCFKNLLPRTHVTQIASVSFRVNAALHFADASAAAAVERRRAVVGHAVLLRIGIGRLAARQTRRAVHHVATSSARQSGRAAIASADSSSGGAAYNRTENWAASNWERVTPTRTTTSTVTEEEEEKEGVKESVRKYVMLIKTKLNALWRVRWWWLRHNVIDCI